MMNPCAIIYQDSSLKIMKQNYWEAKCNMAPHTHDHLTISLLLNGSLLEHTSEKTSFAQPGFLSIKPAHVLHSDVFTQNCTFLSINIRDWKYYKLDFKEWEWIPHSEAFKYFINIIQSSNKKDSINDLNKFLKVQSPLRKKQPQIPEWLSDVYNSLILHYKENVQISHLAKEAGKHPVHLARAFKKAYGMDLKTYQKQLRIHYAMTEAMNKTQNLTQAAYASGFADQSHFSREFKKITNHSPKQTLLKLNV